MGSVVLERQATYALDSSIEGSIASPHGSADGLDVTAKTASPTKITVIERDDLGFASGDLAYEFPEIVIDDHRTPVIAHIQTSTIVEMFEGVVQRVCDDTMEVILRAKISKEIPDHVMAIDLSFVQFQDRELVAPGAVFYLTMFRETTGRTIKNSEEIRFRRQPNWNRTMLKRLEDLASELY